jgi:hypothetical protein
MADLVTLVCPPGADDYPIAEGTTAFAPYRENYRDPASRWLVDVPLEMAGRLIHNGGFFAMKTKAAVSELPAGMVLLRHPDGNGCGWNGIAYEPDADGAILVPREAISDLGAHGFAVESVKPKS